MSVSGSQRGWVASGALAAVVAGGYLGLMPLLSSSISAAPQWPEPLREVSSQKLVVARIGATSDDEKAAAVDAATLIRATPTSGEKVKARKPAIKVGPRTPQRRSVVKYTPHTHTHTHDATPAPRAADPAPAARPAAPAKRVSPPATTPRPTPPAEAEIVPIDVPSLAGGEPAPAPDDDPGSAGSGG